MRWCRSQGDTVGDELYSERFFDDVAAVADAMSPDEGEYDELVAVVHPGFSVYHPSADPSWKGYDAFLEGLDETIDGVEEGEVAVLYPEAWRRETELFLGDDGSLSYVSTENGSALLTGEGVEQMAMLLDGLEDEGVVRVTGEVNGCCYTHVRQLFEEVEDRVAVSYEVEEGRAYPDERVWRL